MDASPSSVRVLRDNLAKMGFSQKTRVWMAPVPAVVRRLSSRGEKFDLIFLDPPYDSGQINRVVKLIAHEELLREGGILIAEHSVREAVEDGCDPLALRDQRRYGGTLVSFFGQKINKT